MNRFTFTKVSLYALANVSVSQTPKGPSLVDNSDEFKWYKYKFKSWETSSLQRIKLRYTSHRQTKLNNFQLRWTHSPPLTLLTLHLINPRFLWNSKAAAAAQSTASLPEHSCSTYKSWQVTDFSRAGRTNWWLDLVNSLPQKRLNCPTRPSSTMSHFIGTNDKCCKDFCILV
jgi:hypothetical protein